MQTEVHCSEESATFWCSKRFFVAVLMFFGSICTFAMSSDLNIAIVEMTSSKTIATENGTRISDPEFNWDSQTKGLILSAFPCGLSLSIFGGYLVKKFGDSKMISTGVTITALITILNPFIIRYSFNLFLIARVVEGIVEGFAVASFIGLWTQWAPPQERSRLILIGFSGMHVSTVITYPICGCIIHMYGWPAAFYATGGVSLFWAFLWFLLVPNTPSDDKCISKKELNYIIENHLQIEQPKNVLGLCNNMIKWKCLQLTAVNKFTYGIGYSIIITCFPMYIKDLANAEIYRIGIYSSLPNVITAVTAPMTGFAADYILNNNILTVKQFHKMSVCSGLTIDALLLFLVGSLSASLVGSLICFTLFKVALSMNMIICQICCVKISPKCSREVLGFLSIFYMLSLAVGPIVIGLVVNNQSESEWNTCFFICAIFILIGEAVYVFLGSSDPQPWHYEVVNYNCDKLDSSK